MFPPCITASEQSSPSLGLSPSEASSRSLNSLSCGWLQGEPGGGAVLELPQMCYHLWLFCSKERTHASSSPAICSPDTRGRNESHKDKFLKCRQAPALQLLQLPGARMNKVRWPGITEDTVSSNSDSKCTSSHLPSVLFLGPLPKSPRGGRIDPEFTKCSLD